MDKEKKNEETDSVLSPSIDEKIEDTKETATDPETESGKVTEVVDKDKASELGQEATKESQDSIGNKDEALVNKENLENIEKSGENLIVENINSEKSEESSEPPKFRLRIVPLERLLEKRDATNIEADGSKLSKEKVASGKVEKSQRSLPPRSGRANYSIIELSSSDESTDEEETIVEPTERRSSGNKENIETNKNKVNNSNSHKRTINSKARDSRHKHQKSGGCSTSESSSRNSPAEQAFKLKRCVVRLKRYPVPSENSNNNKKKSSSEKGQKSPSSNRNKRRLRLDNSTSSSSSESEKNKRTKPATVKRTKKIMAESGEESDFEIPDVNENDEESVEESPISDLDCKSSASEEILPARKRRVFQKKNSSSDDSDFVKSSKSSKKKRRVKKRNSSDDSGSDDEKQKNKRKDIRKIIKTKDLDVTTKEATKEEEERRKRIQERQKIYNQIYVKPESTEVSELVLDFDPDSKKALLQVDKGLLKKLKPHQVTGVKFMWDACFETLKDAVDESGSGCILAHCMGLGKTLQVVTLSHTLLSNSHKTNVERVLVISPLSTLNNWAREFVYWMGFAHKKNIEIYDMSRYKDKTMRIFKLNEWVEDGGVCIIGYDMYRILANEKAKGLRKKQREQLQRALIDPGPDLVVCDEGHLLKNEKTSISKAVTKMRTRRRIVLTGTPLQNNLKEYYCMIQFIKPSLLGTYKEYMNRFVNPITNGQYTDSTERDIRLMKHRSHILHTMLEGCMQRRDYSVLAPYLPPKHEYVVYTTLSELQQLLYDYYMTTHRDLIHSDIGGKGARLFQDFQDLRRIWTHPKSLQVNSEIVIAKRLLSQDDSDLDDFICDDEDDTDGSKSDSSADSSKSFGSGGGKVVARKIKTRNDRKDNDSDLEEIPSGKMEDKDDPSEWWKRFVEEQELNNIFHSPKLVILMQLLEQCEAIGDKVLVFSQSLQSLDVIEHFLGIIDSKTRGYEYEGNVGDYKGFWSPGEDYFRLDGSCSVEQRESMCKKFNDPLNLRSRLFLISTRAGGLGINLVAANRVVIFDVSWNPSHDTQSIFRVYRFGQEKPCYIYRLIAMGTMEQKVYERQVIKQATAKRVIDEHQISRHYNSSDLQELYTYELTPSVDREIPILPKDRLFAELLAQYEKLLFKYHEHDSLLENEESENLSEAERKAAWSEYEAEKTRNVQTAQYIAYDRNAYGGMVNNQFPNNTGGPITSNKIFGFRTDVLLQLLNMKVTKDYPDLSQNQVIQLVPTYLQRLYAEMNGNDPTMYKELLQLHTTLAHPSGMYMNPLLYANQQPSAAGYFQSPTGPNPQMAPGIPRPTTSTQPSPAAPGFEPNKVYEID